MKHTTMDATTIIAVRHNDKIAMAGDGQVTLGSTVVKHNACKVRKIFDDRIVVGFAGATADAFTLFERFEGKLNQYGGDLTRAAVEMAKEWRTDRALRRLEALLLTADTHKILLISGAGDVIEPEDNVIAIGSGGDYARAAALAYLETTDFLATDIAVKSLKIASRICIYTNSEITVEEL